MGVSYALYDEGAFRTSWWMGFCQHEIAPESLRVVNNILSTDQQIEEVDLGKYYGSKEK